MNRYLIKETEESGIYERGDNYLLHITLRDNLVRATVGTPSTCSISIIDPCNATLIDNVSMVSDGEGIYHYDYTISDTAVYGKYKVTVLTTGFRMKKTFSMFIFPWDANREVRDISGIGQKKSINDAAFNRMIWDAYKEALENVFIYHEYEEPNYTRDAGTTLACIDGINTTFFTRYTNIADHDGDGVIAGWGEQSCGTDIDGVWKDSDGFCNQAKITVANAECGKLTITQTDGTAIPNTAKGIYLKYHARTPQFTDELFKDAVNYLAAHKAIIRFGELERATSADLNSAQNIKYVDPKRMLSEYERVLRLIREPMIVGVN